MISEIEAGNVETLIVKDMSRLGRNYLQVGFYTEILFPQKKVHFLAINNSIDSNKASDNDFAPFLNIMNEWYAKDTSNKIRSVFDARMKDGKRCSGSIPYGYNRVPSDKQALVVDPVAAEVVKRIFLLANEGKSTRAIAEKLTEEKVLIPSAYAKEYHPEQYNGQKYSDPNLWGMSTVRGILERQEYLGHTVLRKTVGTNFKLHKRKSTAQDEQYLFQNTHEPIISQELWDSVHRRRKRVQRASAWGSHTNRLSGYLYCADCGRRLTLQTHYSKRDGSVQYSYRCGGYASRVNSCTAHSISADNVEALVLSSVKRFSQFVLQDENAFAAELQSLWIERLKTEPKNQQSELQRCQKRYDELSNLVRGLYENLKLNNGFELWNEPLVDAQHLIAMQKACAAVKDEFSNYSARFNTPAKLNNFTLTFEEIDKLAEQIALIKAIAEYVTFKTDCANNVSYLSNIEFIDLGANFKQKLEAAKDEFRSARDSILTGTSGDVAAQKVNAALEKVKEEYIGIYFEEHKKKRLDIDDAKRRGKLQESSVLANLRKLRGVEILSAAKLTKIEQDMANLKVCYELTPTELKTTHICPHCHYNLGDQVPNVAGQLDNLDIRIDDLVTEWTQTLLNTISDPIVASQKEYLSAEQQKAIDDFIASGTLPKRVDDFFIKAIQALLKGFEPVVVDAKDLMDKLTKLPPMDEVSFKQKLNELIAGYTKGKDEGKLRIIVK